MNTETNDAGRSGVAGTRREFVTFSRAWYSRSAPKTGSVVDDIVLFDGKSMEFVIEWDVKAAADLSQPVPRLCMFNESWSLLAKWPDVFAALSQLPSTPPPSVSQVEELLLKLGFVDVTKTKDPRDARQRS